MSLLQIGGRDLIQKALADCALAEGEPVTAMAIEAPLGGSSAQSVTAISNFSVAAPCRLIVHRLAGLRALGNGVEERKSWLQTRIEEGHILHFYSYDEFAEKWTAEDLGLLTTQNFQQISLASPFHTAALKSYREKPCAVRTSTIQPLYRPPRAQQIHVLYLAHHGNEDEAAKVAHTFSALKDSGLRFSASVFDSNEVQSIEELESLIGACDLFIEQLRQPYFGSLAIYAMAKGKPVISRNSAQNHSFAHHTTFSPVIDASESQLFERLHAIIREPSCLRDLNKRSRQYVETYHNADLVYGSWFE